MFVSLHPRRSLFWCRLTDPSPASSEPQEVGNFDMAVVRGGCRSKRGDLPLRTATGQSSAGAEPSGQDQLVHNLLIQTNSIQKLHHNKPSHTAEATRSRLLFFKSKSAAARPDQNRSSGALALAAGLQQLHSTQSSLPVDPTHLLGYAPGVPAQPHIQSGGTRSFSHGAKTNRQHKRRP